MSKLNFIALAILFVFTATLTQAQTSSFTYQGRFTDGGSAANGTYEMQFKLFDGVGNQIGTTITNGAVLVSNGVFTVQLDYGAAAFSGADRYLEMGVRPAGDVNAYTILAPRQQLTSAVYAIRAGSATNADAATNAMQLGGVSANQYVQTNDARLSDARVPAPGSSNYIQNSAAVQASANFNISGNGTAGGTLSANTVNAVAQYNLGGNRVLSVAGTDNTFAGVSAGSTNTPGSGNSFFGRSAGGLNTSSNNSFFGRAAGALNTTGGNNSFFGSFTGDSNTEGFGNSFFGSSAGTKTVTGNSNSFFGNEAGFENQTGHDNTFIGLGAGSKNISGNENTAIGFQAQVTGNPTNATAIGASALATQSNSLVLGSIKGNTFVSEDTNVGIGTTAPKARFHIAVNGGNIVMGDAGCSPGFTGIGFGSSLFNCGNYSLLGNATDTIINRPTGGRIYFREDNATQMVIAPGGVVGIVKLGEEGSTQLCRNTSNQISTCSSSLRYKTNIQPFIGGLSVLNRLRPITFDWKKGGMHDLGFGAEDIAAIEPLLVTRNDKGEVEGVKYDRITAVLVNAMKEQQRQIEGLKKLVCRRNRHVAVCK